MVRAEMIICASQIHLQSQGNQSITHYCSVMKHRNCLVCGTQRRFNMCCCYCFQCCCICVPCTFIEHLLVPRYSEPQHWDTDKVWSRVKTENAEEYNWNTSWKHRFESWNTIGTQVGTWQECWLAGSQILKHRAGRAPLKVGRGRNYLWNARPYNTLVGSCWSRALLGIEVDFGTPGF